MSSAPANYHEEAPPGTFFARDNVTRFIRYARGLGVDDSVMFEAGDLVDRTNEKHVLYSIMELARLQKGITPPRVCLMLHFEQVLNLL